jgi:glutamyl/glutaminyl-tRNA synthetase
LRRKSDGEIADLIRPYLEEIYGSLPGGAWLERLAGAIRDDLVRLEDAVALAEWALDDAFALTAEAEATLAEETARPVLVLLLAELARVVLLDEATAASILDGLRAHFRAQQGWQAKQVYWPIRAALSGHVQGPPLSDMMALLGKERCMRRAAAVLAA